MNHNADITIVINAKETSAIFADALRKSVKSIVSQETYDPERVAMVVTADTETERLEALCLEALEPKISPQSYRALGLDDLEKAKEGSRYLLFMENGDFFEEGALKVLLKHARKNKYTAVFVTRRQWIKKKKSEFCSCTLVESEPQMAVRNALIRTEAVTDIRALMSRDEDAVVALSKILLLAGGYYMEYGTILTYGPEAEPLFTPTAEKMQSLMTFAEENDTGGSIYIERYILQLLSINLDLRPEMGDVSGSLALIKDETILTTTGFNVHEKLYLLRLKYGKDILEDAEVRDDGTVYWKNERLFAATAKNRFKLNIIDVRDDMIYMSGVTDLNMLGDKYRYFLYEENGNKIPLELLPDPVRDITWPNGEMIHRGKQFHVSIPLRIGGNFEFIMEDPDERQIALNPKMERFSHLASWEQDAYYAKGKYLIRLFFGRFYIEKYTRWKHLVAEIKFERRLWILEKRKAILYRLLHYVTHPFQRKPVWIVADRPHVANDNGEHMFKYLMKSEAAKKHQILFLLREDSKDYPRLKAIGPVLKYGTIWHHLKFMETKRVIAAAANDLATSPFGLSQPFYRNLCNYEFVYLRHGVAKDDQSRFLNRQRKNIRLLVSTSAREHDAIIAGKYGYTEREVILTGLPRFDNLYDERKGKITILPTWRKNLEGGRIGGSAQREYIFDFKDTDYFKFYNSLINDPRLLDAMRKHGFTGTFYLHPVFEGQFNDFKSNELIEVGTTVADYQTLFRESDIMVTDFSSVAFDFAYLKKPLIYSQFDEATFYRDHSWDRGYFTYREDGFGPITNTVDETVDALIHYIETGCQMEDIYLKRVEAFFPYTDRNNCERVYNEIMKIENEQ